MDRFEKLEKLGALRSAGILSDEEFAAEKRRILGEPESAGHGQPAEPSYTEAPQAEPWWKARRRLLALVAGALVLGVLFSILVTLDIFGRDSSKIGERSASAKPEGTQSEASQAASADLAFDKPSDCRPGGALRQVLEKLNSLAPGAEAESPIEVPGLDVPIVPRVESVGGGGAGQAVAAQLAISAPWQGLTITHLRTVRWPGGTASIQLRFAENAATAHRTLKAAGFPLAKVGEVQSVPSDGRQVLIGLEEVPEGAALTCVSKAADKGNG
jgi:hypothetical protein